MLARDAALARRPRMSALRISVSGQLKPATHKLIKLLHWARIGPAHWHGYTVSQNRRCAEGKQQERNQEDTDNRLFHFFSLMDLVG
jgi:hypothetical protein